MRFLRRKALERELVLKALEELRTMDIKLRNEDAIRPTNEDEAPPFREYTDHLRRLRERRSARPTFPENRQPRPRPRETSP